MENYINGFISEPARRTPVLETADVLVVGGGPTGIAAAVAAARAGARVILAERYGYLGGMATAALVGPLMSYHTACSTDPDQPAPIKVIGGLLDELVDRLIAIDGALPPSPRWEYMVPIDAEAFKTVVLKTVLDAGVRLLFHSLAVDVVREGSNLRGVVFETKSGRIAVLADVVVDATGDADIAARAGVPYELGRQSDGLCQPLSLIFKLGGVDLQRFEDYTKSHPGEFHLVQGLRDLVAEATHRGDLSLSREDILFFPTPVPGEVVVNSTRVTGSNGLDVVSLTAAEIVGHQQAEMLLSFFRRYVPGFEHCRLLQTGHQIGVRETRRIMGDYQLTESDVLTGARFPDVVARGAYPVDMHSPDGRETVMRRLPPGVAYDIPYRALVPQQVEGLLVAGRALSGTHEAQSSYRVMPICIATGQAAGIAAALSAKHGFLPRAVDITVLQASLREQGAILY